MQINTFSQFFSLSADSQTVHFSVAGLGWEVGGDVNSNYKKKKKKKHGQWVSNTDLEGKTANVNDFSVILKKYKIQAKLGL